MKFMVPDYYADFRCSAGECRHSCCIGWEIDVDEIMLSKYRQIGGPLGEKLRSSIICEDGTYSFRLNEEERCPFLDKNGLCEIITNIGEEYLCDICNEHPRFYNEIDELNEMGIGLCCEEAAKLIISNDMNLQCEYDDGFSGVSPEFAEILRERDEIFTLLRDRSASIRARFDGLEKKYDFTLNKEASYWAGIYAYLEKLDDNRDKYISAISCQNQLILPENERFQPYIERLAIYFIYRHYTQRRVNGYSPAEIVRFALLSCYAISTAFLAGKELKEKLVDTARMYSSEIEYSDRNIDILLKILSK